VKRYFLLVPVAIGMLAAAVMLAGSEKESFPDLRLSDFPETFNESTMIVIGSNASEIEIQAANEIAEYLKEKTGNKEVLIKKYSEISEEEKKNYNLIVVGTPKSNGMLREIYEMADVLRVNETFPGEGKGVLEIARNPWNESRAMLLVEGWDECSIILALESVRAYNTSLTPAQIRNSTTVDVIVQAIEDAELIDWKASTVPEYKGVGVFRVAVKVLNVTKGNVCLKKDEQVTLIFRKPIPKLNLPKPILKGQKLSVSGLYTVDKKTITSDVIEWR